MLMEMSWLYINFTEQLKQQNMYEHSLESQNTI